MLYRISESKKRMKINDIHIRGLRGVKGEVSIPLGSNSALFYGDNGTGKSTISDVLEWFYYDKVEHLSDGEIGTKGHSAMRNISLPDDDLAFLRLNITGITDELSKTIKVNGSKLVTTISNNNDTGNDYMLSSESENIILRYKDLDGFARATKRDRLNKLSDIIGYAQVTKTRNELQATCNALKKEIKLKSFEDQISYQQSQILEQFNRNIALDEQFVEVVNELIKPFDLKVSGLHEVNEVLQKIKQVDDSKVVSQEALLAKIQEKIILLPPHIEELEKQYDEYNALFKDISSNVEKLKNLILAKLLSSGKEVLENEDYNDNKCPLCLEEQDSKALLASITERLESLEDVKQEKNKLDELKKSLVDQIYKTEQILDSVLDEQQINDISNNDYQTAFARTKSHLEKYKKELALNPLSTEDLIDSSVLKVNITKVMQVQEKAKKALQEIRAQRASNPKLDAYNKIKIAGNAYALVRKLETERKLYNKQLDNIEVMYSEFRRLQKNSIEAFLDAFSDRINAIFKFLNPTIDIDNIRLVSIEENDELVGITIEMDFWEMKGVSPPHKYLSESYQNCVGIAFFLASVEAFNTKNRFIVFDDVIASFDEKHRKRFADLLVEQYKDYQLILLTHEISWFELVRNLIKGSKWLVREIKYNDSKGTYFDEAAKDLQERIEEKIKNGNKDNLGNDARKYLESILKEIAYNLEAKLPFRFNIENENRMSYELLTGIKSTLKSRKCALTSNEVIDRLLGSTFIGNKDSHDSSYEPSLSDLKAFWQDIRDFEGLFFCGVCESYVSTKYYDNVSKKIRCRKGEISYSWKN